MIEGNKGTWIYDPNACDWNIGGWRCGACGCRNNNIGGPSHADPLLFTGSRFCPNCGDRKDEAMTARVNQKALGLLHRHRFRITRDQFKTLYARILAGEDKAAMKCLWRLIRKPKE